MDKHEIKFEYTDSEFLDRLVNAIPEEGYGLSVHLMPDEDELVEKSMLEQSLRSPSLVLSEDLKKEALADEQLYDLIMLLLWKKYDIIPFQSLVFDYRNKNENPKIVFCGSYSQLEEDPLKYEHPNLFIGNRRWFQVSMINGERPQDIRIIKEATSDFLFEGYTLFYVSAEQNSANRDGYYSRDALLTATCGECEIYGEKPEKFKNLVKKLL